MSTFIHNEPTCLSILQEAGLPQAFLKVVGGDFPISAEVVSALPNAFGAICLNKTGLDAFTESNPINKFLEIFLNDNEIRLLLDSDVPNLVGSSLDELIRHHPSLKQSVFDGIHLIVGKLIEIGKQQSVTQFSFGDSTDEDSSDLLLFYWCNHRW